MQSIDSQIESEINRLRRTHQPTDDDDFRDDIVRGMQTLQQIGQPAIPRLIDLLLDENESSGLRSRITGTLAMIGDSIAIEPLITTLKDSNVIVRWHAIKALEK